VITHIALDHQEYLGETLFDIAFEKAGIIKPDKPVVIGIQNPEIEAYLENLAMQRRAPCHLASKYHPTQIEISEKGTFFALDPEGMGREINFHLNLLGAHQIDNCLNLFSGIPVLQKAGFFIYPGQIASGLATVVWPGRMERIGVVDSMKLYLDGAHNPDGFKALSHTIQTIYAQQKMVFLIGILHNRPLMEMAEILAPLADLVIVTQVPDPKSATATDLYACFNKLGIPIEVETDPTKALTKLLALDCPVAVACGSLYLIGKLRSILLHIGD